MQGSKGVARGFVWCWGSHRRQTGNVRVWLANVGVFTDNWMDIELGAHRFHKKVSKIEPDNITKTWGYTTERTATITHNASATAT